MDRIGKGMMIDLPDHAELSVEAQGTWCLLIAMHSWALQLSLALLLSGYVLPLDDEMMEG